MWLRGPHTFAAEGAQIYTYTVCMAQAARGLRVLCIGQLSLSFCAAKPLFPSAPMEPVVGRTLQSIYTSGRTLYVPQGESACSPKGPKSCAPSSHCTLLACL